MPRERRQMRRWTRSERRVQARGASSESHGGLRGADCEVSCRAGLLDARVVSTLALYGAGLAAPVAEKSSSAASTSASGEGPSYASLRVDLEGVLRALERVAGSGFADGLLTDNQAVAPAEMAIGA